MVKLMAMGNSFIHRAYQHMKEIGAMENLMEKALYIMNNAKKQIKMFN